LGSRSGVYSTFVPPAGRWRGRLRRHSQSISDESNSDGGGKHAGRPSGAVPMSAPDATRIRPATVDDPARPLHDRDDEEVSAVGLLTWRSATAG
jgi:hypothetical protein